MGGGGGERDDHTLILKGEKNSVKSERFVFT